MEDCDIVCLRSANMAEGLSELLQAMTDPRADQLVQGLAVAANDSVLHELTAKQEF